MIFTNPAGAPELACDHCGCRWFDRMSGACYECGEPVPRADIDAYHAALQAFHERKGIHANDPSKDAQMSERWFEDYHPGAVHELGTLQVGAPGDVSIMELVEGPVTFVDTRNNKRDGKLLLKPVQTVINGVAFGRPYQAPFAVR